jgi:hypothetical protein
MYKSKSDKQLVKPLGIVIWWLLDSPFVCFQSTDLQQMDLLEVQQKLCLRRIWNFWEILPSGGLAWLPRDSDKQLEDLRDTQIIIHNTISARPIPRPPMIHPYGTRALWIVGIFAAKHIASYFVTYKNSHHSFNRKNWCKKRKSEELWEQKMKTSEFQLLTRILIIFQHKWGLMIMFRVNTLNLFKSKESLISLELPSRRF